jgi:hypothetical protein
MHQTQAPDYRGGGKILVTVLKSVVVVDGAEVPVIAVSKHGRPVLVVEESGDGRLIRPRKGRSSYSYAMTYASPKVFHIDNPSEKPVSDFVALYEQALATLK